MSPRPEQVPMSAPDIDDSDVTAVVEVLRSGRLSLGPAQERFEDLLARYCGVKHAVAVSSGTAALHLLVRAMGVGPGDEILVPSFTFAASVNCILYEGAVPVFVDTSGDLQSRPSGPGAQDHTQNPCDSGGDLLRSPAGWDEISGSHATRSPRDRRFCEGSRSSAIA